MGDRHMTTTRITASDLDQFTGSQECYRHWTRKLVYTEGVKYLADKAGAHWLIDLIASHQVNPRVAAEPFQVWRLQVAPGSLAATATVTDGNHQQPIAQQQIDYTDFPLSEVTLYLIDNTLLLPSEY